MDWTVAPQASLSSTISRSLLKLMSIDLAIPPNHLILCCPFFSCSQSFPAAGSFPKSQIFASGGLEVLELQRQHQSFQWIFRADFLYRSITDGHILYIFRLYVCLVTWSCPTLWDPMDCSLPGSSVHGILQVITLEWVDISSSRGSSRARDQTCDSCVSCTAGGFFMAEPSGNPRMFRLYNTISFKVVQHDSLMYVYIATVDV